MLLKCICDFLKDFLTFHLVRAHSYFVKLNILEVSAKTHISTKITTTVKNLTLRVHICTVYSMMRSHLHVEQRIYEVILSSQFECINNVSIVNDNLLPIYQYVWVSYNLGD